MERRGGPPSRQPARIAAAAGQWGGAGGCARSQSREASASRRWAGGGGSPPKGRCGRAVARMRGPRSLPRARRISARRSANQRSRHRAASSFAARPAALKQRRAASCSAFVHRRPTAEAAQSPAHLTARHSLTALGVQQSVTRAAQSASLPHHCSLRLPRERGAAPPGSPPPSALPEASVR